MDAISNDAAPPSLSPEVAEALRVVADASSSGDSKRKNRIFDFNLAHARKFGLAVADTDAATGTVLSAVCLFCKHFGREQKAHTKRKATANLKYFKHSFRTDQYVQHLASQHPSNWARYQAASDPEKHAFFPAESSDITTDTGSTKSTTSDLYNSYSIAGANAIASSELPEVKDVPKKRAKLATASSSGARDQVAAPLAPASTPVMTVVPTLPVQDERSPEFEVKKAIVDIVCGSSLWRPKQGLLSCELVSTPSIAAAGAPEQDEGSQVYRVAVRQRLQLDLAVDYMAAGLTSRQIAQTLGAAVKLSVLDPSLSATEDEAVDLVRLSTTASLDAISKLLEKSWAFSLGLHTVTLTPAEHSFLDIRVRVYAGGQVCDLHLVAIPLADASNATTAVSAYQTFGKAMDTVFPPWRGYLVGLSSHGEAQTSDRVSELMTRIQQEASNPVYRTWCGSSQLDFTMKHFYRSLLSGSFVTTFRALTGYIRSHEGLTLDMGQAPSVVNPNSYLAMGKDTQWITDKRVRLRKYLDEEKPTFAPEDAWWLAFFVVNWVAGRANEAFKKLQNRHLVTAQQTAVLSELAAELIQNFHVQGPFSADATNGSGNSALDDQFTYSRQRQYAISKTSVCEFMGDLGVFVNNIITRVDPLALDVVVESLAMCLANLIESLMSMTVEGQLSNPNGNAADPLPPVLPHEVAPLSGRAFAALLARHSDHLRAFFSEEEMDVIDQEHQALRRASTKEKALLAALSECDDETPFECAWQFTGGRFRALQNFAGGLATVFPSSDGNSVTSSSCALVDLPRSDSESDAVGFGLPLADFALEGTLHAQQFAQLQSLVNESSSVVL